MNQIDMFSTLIDAARQMPENRHLNAAIRQAEKKLQRLREKKLQRDGYQQMRAARAQCIECGCMLDRCNCWDVKRHCWLHSPVAGAPIPTVIPCYSEVVRN